MCEEINRKKLTHPLNLSLSLYTDLTMVEPSELIKHSPGLGVDDLGDVLEETLSSSIKWYNIGLRLKVPVAKLDSIGSQFSDPGECLREVLKEWLKGTAGTKPAWGVLVEALRSQTVGESQLADQLETKHCHSESSSQGELYMYHVP